MSPDLDRTTAALEAAGLDLRRVREEPTPGGAPRQAFFRMGEVVLEVVQAPADTRIGSEPEGPAGLSGTGPRRRGHGSSPPACSGPLLGEPRPGRSARTHDRHAAGGAAGLGPGHRLHDAGTERLGQRRGHRLGGAQLDLHPLHGHLQPHRSAAHLLPLLRSRAGGRRRGSRRCAAGRGGRAAAARAPRGGRRRARRRGGVAPADVVRVLLVGVLAVVDQERRAARPARSPRSTRARARRAARPAPARGPGCSRRDASPSVIR